MWYAFILAMGLLDNQPTFQAKIRSEHGYATEGECLKALHDAEIQLATDITFKGLSPRISGQCLKG